MDYKMKNINKGTILGKICYTFSEWCLKYMKNSIFAYCLFALIQNIN